MQRRIALLALSLLCAPATAQNLSLDKAGGGLPGLSTFHMAGTPLDPYLLVIALNEQQTPIPSLGLTLEVPLTLVSSTYAIPGFFGQLDNSGAATASLPFPGAPIFESVTFSLQAIGLSNPFQASNLVRLTPQLVGTFKPSLGTPSVPIIGGGTAIAPGGDILFVGGSGPVAQSYASRTEDWSVAGATFGVGLLSQTTGLPDGRVLFTGGMDLAGQPTAAAAVYDPATQQTTTLAMGSPRAGHGASVMGNGKVLITGGIQAVSLTSPLALFSSILASTEIFDPTTNTFAAGPNMLEPRAMHSSTTISGGSVLIAGGLTLLPIVSIPTVSATAYRFNPTTGSFGLPAFFSGARFLHSAVGLSNGKVLLAGGLSLDLRAFLASGSIADIIIRTRTDCQLFSQGLFGLIGAFATVDGMQEGRAGAALASLPGGGALIAGGFSLTIDITTGTFQANATATADLFSQSPNAIQPTGSMAAPRLFPLAVNLPDGTTMVVGGGPLEAEIYQR